MLDELYGLEYRLDSLFHNALFAEKAMHKGMRVFAIRQMRKESSAQMGYGLYQGKKRKERYVISLTSFPARMKTLHICLRSILTQSFQPDRIVLWLAEKQFPNGLEDVPVEVRQLTTKGLEIRFCEDLRSHKKYYYTMQEEKDACVITCDDDVVYPKNMLELLVMLHEKFPNAVCCNRGHWIKKDKNGISSYNEWGYNYNGEIKCSDFICPTGVGGVLYPPNSLSVEVFEKEDIRQRCFGADDLWLKVMALRNGYTTAITSGFPRRLYVVPESQAFALNKENVSENQNGVQLKAILEKYPVVL